MERRKRRFYPELRCKRRAVARCFLALLGLIVAFTSLLSVAQASDEVIVSGESRNLFAFTKYIKWPENKFPKGDDTLRVGFVGNGPVRAVFEESNTQLRTDQRRIVVISVSSGAEARNCHILFVESERPALRDLLTEARRSNVLTVGMSDRFISQGGMVNFYVSNGTVRFQINNDAMRHSKLQPSSRMLSIAAIVDSTGKPVPPDSRLIRD